ncbi:MAG: hypothetical protein GF388_00095 [Candidatus Aegiribacteria sp.]|nr:hypothetical protein [Candidatus Aegiribacteria sp.]
MGQYDKEREELVAMFAQSRIQRVEVSDRGTVSIPTEEIKRSPTYKKYFKPSNDLEEEQNN